MEGILSMYGVVHGRYTFKVWKEAKPDMKRKRRDQEEGWQILTTCLRISDNMIMLTCSSNENISGSPSEAIKEYTVSLCLI